MYPTFRKRFQKKTLRGFSLGEVLLAAFVLTAGLLSVIALIASSLRYSMDTRDAIIATGLAQEGVELARNVRDNDLAAGNDGFNLSDFNPGRRHCRRDYNDSVAVLDCSSAATDTPANNRGRYYLQYSGGGPSGGLYAHIGTAVSKFSRYIYIDYNNGVQKDATVRSFVYWGSFIPPSSGDSTNCTASNKCVFTEIKLTAWK